MHINLTQEDISNLDCVLRAAIVVFFSECDGETATMGGGGGKGCCTLSPLPKWKDRNPVKGQFRDESVTLKICCEFSRWHLVEIYGICTEVAIRLAGSLVIMPNSSNVAICGGTNSGSSYSYMYI